MDVRLYTNVAPMNILKKIWRVGRWVLLALVVGYLVLVAVGTYDLDRKAKNAETVAAIHAQKITLDLVLNTYRNLPEAPDPATDEATVAGTDANSNGIRDDAELTIFLWHRDSARIRAAELQYAMAIQTILTQVFSTETMVAALQENSRAYYCMGVDVRLSDAEIKRIKNLVLDTDMRRQKYNEIYEKYMTSYADLDAPNCDIDLKSLPN